MRLNRSRGTARTAALLAASCALLAGLSCVPAHAGPAPAGVSTPVPTRPPSQPCAVTYSAHDWGTGFSASLQVTNLGDTPIAGWVLRLLFSGNQRITTSWNATWSQAPPSVWLSSAPGHHRVDPGQTVPLGFNAVYSGANEPPTGLTLNGVPCAVTYR
ncbi:hypothetical protein Skr01_73340 [Sphaerisporangium krabiense]|uniref:Cellulase/cellobiase CelA1 n=1 Tax=Sphaerisporangium krabiense TaxID=763782 RepID=A0A7W8Z925_9ACTN|nr:cellulose binding domain-containing protein [Sphaerisporangium krabiense]MBB5629591.1 cellulase/cellobiase CelA1 [Sphaerisporangium krabiense]GII67249.1 hypothetical protein Skr01_73340 [Sphaerisporangium krabiense]